MSVECVARSVSKLFKNIKNGNMSEPKNLYKIHSALKTYRGDDMEFILKHNNNFDTTHSLFSNNELQIDLLSLQPQSFYHNPFSTVIKVLEGEFFTELDLGFKKNNPTFNLYNEQTIIIGQKHTYYNKTQTHTSALIISKKKTPMDTPLL